MRMKQYTDENCPFFGDDFEPCSYATYNDKGEFSCLHDDASYLQGILSTEGWEGRRVAGSSFCPLIYKNGKGYRYWSERNTVPKLSGQHLITMMQDGYDILPLMMDQGEVASDMRTAFDMSDEEEEILKRYILQKILGGE